MGKRSNFKRSPRDFYKTPKQAVLPLLPHLTDIREFIEPFAGDGALVDHLTEHGLICVQASDIHPLREDVEFCDAFNEEAFEGRNDFDAIISNSPWSRDILHPYLEFIRDVVRRPTWLLFDADWIHTKQAAPYGAYCSKIVSVGRVKWIEGSKNKGKDNAAWHRFEPNPSNITEFYWR